MMYTSGARRARRDERRVPEEPEGMSGGQLAADRPAARKRAGYDRHRLGPPIIGWAFGTLEGIRAWRAGRVGRHFPRARLELVGAFLDETQRKLYSVVVTCLWWIATDRDSTQI
jgi:hypothetical protein